ncbi:hypothetical protein ULMS_18640 [Patiriisocius marinistellae]|uniref:Uncharacterized protein n=1 Tax=Patiriisocius marinistellae TaxID=2494560 RepID=A0A5J4G1F5_9FLAO|nr:type VI secretion system tube protein TssD [Patiriisocius marinistellae]GEQ86356.1 hypothetical protein ULMS_18640 [Patiriisocius marinistellae]
MSIQSKLYIDDEVFEILESNFQYSQKYDKNNRPLPKVFGGIFNVVVPSGKSDTLTDWAIQKNMMKNAKIIQTPNFLGGSGKSRTFELIDTYCVFDKNKFDAVNDSSMKNFITLSPAILKLDGELLHERNWKLTDLEAEKVAPTTIEKEPETQIMKIEWLDSETMDIVKKTDYEKEVNLVATIINPAGSTASITIEKEDKSEFNNGKKQLSFTESIADDGTVEISELLIEEIWDENRKAKVDKLIATIEHNNIKKKSGLLELIPPPKVLVNFRPIDSWKGEFGFDWVREDDTSLFNDNKFEDIVSKQYKESSFTTLEDDGNAYKGHYKKDATLLKNLKEMYKPFEVTWKQVTDSSGKKVKDKHYTEWLSLKKGKEAKIKIRIDVTEKADFLEFDDNANFNFTPKKIDVKGKTGKKTLTEVVTVKCKNEFTTDQEIIIKAFQEDSNNRKLAGKLNVWSNDASNHKNKKVVFVQIKTDITGSGVPNISNASNEKARINKYLNQAYVELHPDSKIVDIDLTTDTNFSRFVKNGKIKTIGDAVPAIPAVPAVAATLTTPAIPAVPAIAAIPKQALVEYLKEQLKAVDSKYDTYFKAFYFNENGYHAAGNLSGYSAAGANYVVVFASANDQTASHEFLHSFDLPHTFTNSEITANSECTYEAKKTDNLLDYSHNISNDPNNNKRCSLYYWQWIKANKSIT